MKYQLVDTITMKTVGSIIDSCETIIKKLNAAYALNYSSLRWYKLKDIEKLNK